MKKHSVRWVGVTVGLLSVFPAVLLSLSKEPVLLAHAVRTVAAPKGYQWEGTYHWCAPNEVVAVLDSENYDEGRRVVKIRTDTGKVSFLRRHNTVSRDTYQWQFSPDGRWYLCLAMTDQGFAYYLGATDDSQLHRVYAEKSDGTPCEPFAWLGDSYRWVSMPGYTSEPVEIRDLQSATGRRQTLPSGLENCDLILSSESLPTIIRQWQSPEKAVKEIEVGLWDVAEPDKSRKLKVALPVPGEGVEMAVSPRGDRLCWLIYVHEEAQTYNLMRRWLPFFSPARPRDSYQLWTTALDGSSPRLLGVKAITRKWSNGTTCLNPGWEYEGGVYHIAWTRDGTKVSFTFENNLYLLAAE